jgi:hypothetical protein
VLIQIHNHAYTLVGIYSEKTGYKHKLNKLCFTQQQRTDNNGCVLIVVFYLKLCFFVFFLILQVVEFMDISLSRMSAHFIPYRKDKIRTVQKNSGWLVTLTKTAVVIEVR